MVVIKDKIIFSLCSKSLFTVKPVSSSLLGDIESRHQTSGEEGQTTPSDLIEQDFFFFIKQILHHSTVPLRLILKMFWLGMQLCDLVIVRIVPEIRVPQTSQFSEKIRKADCKIENF